MGNKQSIPDTVFELRLKKNELNRLAQKCSKEEKAEKEAEKLFRAAESNYNSTDSNQMGRTRDYHNNMKVFAKPFDPKELVLRIKNIINRLVFKHI